jgi:hypothetical protein
MKTTIGIVIGIIIAVGGFLLFTFLGPQTAQAPNSGTHSHTPTTTPTTVGIADLITITTPVSGAKITSPVTVTGTARGNWYFEASFPVEILDANGKVIGQGHGEAQGDWMTQDFVPFTANLTFSAPATGTHGTIRVKNDNPSGDPARDKHIDLPVTF